MTSFESDALDVSPDRTQLIAERRAHVDAVITSLPHRLEELLACVPRTRPEMQPVPRVPAIYLLSSDGVYQYVGRTRDLRQRLASHMNESGDRYNATFAFRLAVDMAGQLGLNVQRRRAEIEQDPAFGDIFSFAKRRVGAMEIRYLEVPDDIEQTLLEVYVAECLETPWNEFRTH